MVTEMGIEQRNELDGGRAFYGCLLLLWLITAPPLWLLRLGATGGFMASLDLIILEAMEGSPVDIYLLLSPLMLIAIPFWVAHERRHRRRSGNEPNLTETFK